MDIAEEKYWLYDEDIREILCVYLEERFGKVRILEEKNIDKCRADIIAITDSQIVGVEIKSDVDTYARLEKQVKTYDKYFDQNYIAIGRSHAMHVSKHVPDVWGILVFDVVEGAITVEEVRPASNNPKMKPDRQLSFMWRPELQRLLEANGLPKYKAKSKKFVQEKLLEKVEWETLKPQMCEELFERDYTLWDEQIETYKAGL